MIRQLGSPNIFFTKSVNEVCITELIKALKEKEINRILTQEEVSSLTNNERYRLLKKFPIDVVQHLDARFRHNIQSLKKSKSLGEYHVEDHFYRVEFQQRGSAHIHCLFWLADDNGDKPPKLKFSSEQNDHAFKEYFSSIISATSKKNNQPNKDLDYQQHRHTFSCYKNKKGILRIKSDKGHGAMDGLIKLEEIEVPKCRHDFPKFPVPETTIVRKFTSTDTAETQRKAKIDLEKIKKYIIRQTHSQEARAEFEKNSFPQFLQKLGMSQNEYMIALKAAVKQSYMFLPERQCCDVFINNYNSNLLETDPSNHDIQIIDEEEGAFIVASYVAKYISKEEGGQSKLLKAVEQQSHENGDSADMSLKKLAKVLEDTREVSMQELVFRLLGYSMCSASRKHKFIQTQPPSKRDGLIRPNFEDLNDEDNVFCNNIIDYYQNRPDCLEDITLAEFAADYEYEKCRASCVTEPSEMTKYNKHNDFDEPDEDDTNENAENVDKNQTLLLKNNMGVLKRRRRRAIIRYFKGKSFQTDETYIRTLMLLFFPFQNEVIEVHEHRNIMEKYDRVRETVERNQVQFEPNPEFMDHLENFQNENDDSEEDQDEIICPEEETTTAEELEDFMRKQGKIYDGGRIRLEEKLELTNRINSLNLEQRKIFDEIMDFKPDEQFFLYLYGKAGTGKTYLLNTIIPALEFKYLKSGIDLEKPMVLVLSPTATAAKHLKHGDTIHGGLKLNGFEDLEKQMKFGAEACLGSLLVQVNDVVIDEISMVGANFFWKIHDRLKHVLNNKNYFGGLNIIATGDFHQLPPVGDSWVFKNAKVRGRCNSTATNLWKTKFKMYKLTEHVRSGGDEIYSWLQENIASGILNDDMMPYLQSRITPCETEYENDWYRDGRQVMITPTHEVKDAFNETLLSKLDGHRYVLTALDRPSAKTPHLPDLSSLHEGQTKGLRTIICIKINCPIKITKNVQKDDQLVNGTFGYVLDVDEENSIIWCKFGDNVGCRTRNAIKIKHPYHKDAVPIQRTKETISASINNKKYTFQRNQFPLVTAYAITCHASQGLTKERVIIDYRTSRKSHALFFVPFSRAKSLDGIFLKDFKKSYVHCDPDVITELRRLENTATYCFSNIFLFDNFFFNTYTAQPVLNELKISYLNVNGLLHSNHIECLKNDKNLMASDIVCISETKVSQSNSTDKLKIPEFDIVKRVDHPDGYAAMGIILYKRNAISHFEIETHQSKTYQCLVCHLPHGIICFVYINPQIDRETRDHLNELLVRYSTLDNFLCVIGDLNIRTEIGMEENRLLSRMCDTLNVFSSFSEETHVSNGQLDYVLVGKNIQFKYLAGCFRNLYSDHKSVFF